MTTIQSRLSTKAATLAQAGKINEQGARTLLNSVNSDGQLTRTERAALESVVTQFGDKMEPAALNKVQSFLAMKDARVRDAVAVMDQTDGVIDLKDAQHLKTLVNRDGKVTSNERMSLRAAMMMSKMTPDAMEDLQKVAGPAKGKMDGLSALPAGVHNISVLDQTSGAPLNVSVNKGVTGMTVSVSLPPEVLQRFGGYEMPALNAVPVNADGTFTITTGTSDGSLRGVGGQQDTTSAKVTGKLDLQGGVLGTTLDFSAEVKRAQWGNEYPYVLHEYTFASASTKGTGSLNVAEPEKTLKPDVKSQSFPYFFSSWARGDSSPPVPATVTARKFGEDTWVSIKHGEGQAMNLRIAANGDIMPNDFRITGTFKDNVLQGQMYSNYLNSNRGFSFQLN